MPFMTFKTAALGHINDERIARGLAPVTLSSALDRVAQDGDFHGCAGAGVAVVHGRAVDMGERNYFSHVIKGCGLGFTQMLTEAGVIASGVAENIGFFFGTDDEVAGAAAIHSRMMASPEHSANILNPDHTHVGIGVFHTPPGIAWLGAQDGPHTRVFITAQIFAKDPVPIEVAMVGAEYHALAPSRVLDTRTGLGAPAAAPLGQRSTLDLLVTGTGGVPAVGVSAVILNVTVTNPTASSFLTVTPQGEPRPETSSLNFTPGLTVANLVAVKVGVSGRVSIFNFAGSTEVIADVAGWFGADNGAGQRFHPLTPNRVLDTRLGTGTGGAIGPVGADSTLNLQVVDRGGVPAAGVGAVVLNITVTEPTAAGFLAVFPAGVPRALPSNLNFSAGRTVPNLVVAKVGAGGSISIFNFAGTAQLIADVEGWFDDGTIPSGARYTPLTPVRVLDTRNGTGAPRAKLGPGATLELAITGAGGVPALGVGAVAVNVTVAGATAPSSFTVFPTGTSRPNTSNLNFVAGQIVANLVIAKLGTGGRISIFNQSGTTDVIADLAGWFDAG